MSLQGKSLQILTPMYGGALTGNYQAAFTKLCLRLSGLGIGYSWSNVYNESLIPRGRNRLTDMYLKQTKHTHAVYIDADIGFEPDDILAMLELDLDIVGAGCVKKNLDWERIQKVFKRHPDRVFTQDEIMQFSGDYVIQFEKFEGGTREINLGEPQEVRTLGTGLLMVRRNVFEEFQRRYPDRWYESPEDPSALPGAIHDFFNCGVNQTTRKYDSEDYWFCVDCKAIGFKVWLLPWMKTTHMGTFTFVGNLPAVATMAGQI